MARKECSKLLLQKIPEFQQVIDNEMISDTIIDQMNQIIVDYEKTKSDLSAAQSDYKFLEKQYKDKVSELIDLKEQIKEEKEKLPEEEFKEKLKKEAIFFCSRVATFVKEMGGYIWITEYLNQLPDYEKKSYLSAVNAVGAWVESLRQNIN